MPEVDVVVGAHAWIDTDRNILKEYRCYNGISSAHHLLAEYLMRPVQGGGFLWRRGPLLAAGAWDEHLPICQDADLAIRMLLRLGSFRIAALGEAHAVWRAHGGARITTSMSTAKLEAVLGVLMAHAPALRAMENDAINAGLADRFYRLSRLAFALANDRVGDEALRQARAFGLAGHPGTFGHRVASQVLGLKLKTRLTASYYRRISKVPVGERPYPYNLHLFTDLRLSHST